MIGKLIFLGLTLTCIQCAHDLTVDDLAHRLWTDMNTHGNDTITLPDMYEEFVTSYDQDGNREVGEHEFVLRWQHQYHEFHQTAAEFFRRLDIDGDGHLTDHDFSMHLGAADHDNDGALSYPEFLEFMRHVHPESTHHGHGHEPVVG